MPSFVLFLNVISQLDAWYGIRPELQELSICATTSVADWAFSCLSLLVRVVGGSGEGRAAARQPSRASTSLPYGFHQ